MIVGTPKEIKDNERRVGMAIRSSLKPVREWARELAMKSTAPPGPSWCRPPKKYSRAQRWS
jgi:hypothetical protein